MTYWVYVLQSKSTGRYYCGQSDDPQRRLNQHNDPKYTGSKTTKRFTGPWEMIWKQPEESRAAAIRRERQIKKRGIARYLSQDASSVESRRPRD